MKIKKQKKTFGHLQCYILKTNISSVQRSHTLRASELKKKISWNWNRNQQIQTVVNTNRIMHRIKVKWSTNRPSSCTKHPEIFYTHGIAQRSAQYFIWSEDVISADVIKTRLLSVMRLLLNFKSQRPVRNIFIYKLCVQKMKNNIIFKCFSAVDARKIHFKYFIIVPMNLSWWSHDETCELAMEIEKKKKLSIICTLDLEDF